MIQTVARRYGWLTRAKAFCGYMTFQITTIDSRYVILFHLLYHLLYICSLMPAVNQRYQTLHSMRNLHLSVNNSIR